MRGRRLFERLGCLARFSPQRIAFADRFIQRFGGLALVLGRLGTALRLLVTPLVIARGMSYSRFLAYDALGAFLWTAGLVWLGRAAGDVGSWAGAAGTVAIVAALAVASGVLSLVARRRLVRRAGVSRV